MRFILVSQGIYGNIPFFYKKGGDACACRGAIMVQGLIAWRQKDDSLLFHGISDILA
jgi:hypothetical protein